MTGHLVSQQEHRFLSNSPGFDIAQSWAKQRVMASGSSKNDELDAVALPVGVKLSKVQSDHSPDMQTETLGADTTVASGHAAFGVSFSDVRLEKVMDVCSSAITFLRNRMDRPRKRGSNSLSSRAALMLVSFSLLHTYLECHANTVRYKLHSLFGHKGEIVSLPISNQFREVQHIRFHIG